MQKTYYIIETRIYREKAKNRIIDFKGDKGYNKKEMLKKAEAQGKYKVLEERENNTTILWWRNWKNNKWKKIKTQ